MSYQEKFNQTFSEFVEDIIRVFPSDPDFRMYQVAIQTALMMDETLVRTVFHEKVVVPYGDKILARDDSFFLSHTYDEVTSEHNNATDLINKVKDYYGQMKEEDQETVWKYFRILVLLDRKITSA